jgi:hypothetical protein
MKASNWFRAAAVLMLLFAAGHTMGFLTFSASTLEGRAVFEAMNNVRFSSGNASFTYGNFYKGFGLSITVSQLFFAWLGWVLAGMAKQGAAGVKAIAWGMFAVQAAGVVLALMYISAVPAVFSAVAAVCFAMGAVRAEAV